MSVRFGSYPDDARPDIQRRIPATVRKVLDVGCLGGAFGQALKADRPGLTVWGIESDAFAASVASRRLDRVINGSYPDAMPDERFDCIVFNDVLEHMVDPWTALGRTRELIEPDGVVVASIPNVRSVIVWWPLVRYGTWHYRDYGILDRTHLRFFTRSSMVELFEQAHFAVHAVLPSELMPSVGVLPRMFHLVGRRGTDFLAKRFVIVARPVAVTGGGRSTV